VSSRQSGDQIRLAILGSFMQLILLKYGLTFPSGVPNIPAVSRGGAVW
jgi:hypothetical protein